MKKENNLSLRILYILVFLTLISMLVGVSYAYYTKKIAGGDNTRVILKTTNILLKYDESDVIQAYGIMPGWKEEMTFSVENYSNDTDAKYKISLDIISPFTETIEESFIYSVTGISKNTSDVLVNIENSPVPIKTSELGIGQIKSNSIHDYKLKLEFIETNKDQNYLQGKVFIGKIKVEVVYE